MPDIVMAARAVRAVAPTARATLASRLIEQADAAERFQDKTGRAHPRWGNGTLASAALGHPMGSEPRPDDLDFVESLIKVLTAVHRWHVYDRPDAQPMQRCTVGSSASRGSGMSSPQPSQ